MVTDCLLNSSRNFLYFFTMIFMVLHGKMYICGPDIVCKVA